MSDRYLWLSFVLNDTGHAGVAIVSVTEAEIAVAKADIDTRFPQHQPDAEVIAAAIQKAWRTGCNPGGEVGAYEIPVDQLPPDAPLHRLMQRDELERRGFI